jgi:hypothetical protein
MSHPESQLQTEMPDYGTSPVEPQTPQPERAKLGPAQRLIGVLFSPGETFEDINRKPTWLAPLLIAITLGVCNTIFFTWWVNPDWNRITRDMIRQQVNNRGGEMPPEDAITRQVDVMKVVGKLFPAFVVVVTPVLFLIMAGVFALGMMLMQAQTSFKRILSVVAWSFCGVMSVVNSIVIDASLLVRDRESLDAINPMDQSGVSATHLGVLLGSGSSPVLKALASSVDLFSIWLIILLAIGLAAVGGSRKITKGKTATLVLSLWVVLVLLKVLGAVAGGGR